MPSQFYNTVFHLRQAEEIILYDRLLIFTTEDDELVKDLLKIEYETESLGYPFAAPAFDAEAALWGAKTIYTACQLVLYRENKTAELPELLPPYKGDINASAMVSVDLCLRFLPEVISSARNIDPEDSLVEIIENLLTQWHYSGIGHPLKNKITDIDSIVQNECVLQLYIDRVIQKKDMERAMIPLLNKHINATLGIYGPLFWKELKPLTTNEKH